MRTHLLQAHTSINSKHFHIFVIEAPRLAVLLCELQKCILSLQRFQGQICLTLSKVTEERLQPFLKIWVKLRVAQARWDANVFTQNMVENIAAPIESRTLLW